MSVARGFAGRADLADVVAAAFGPARRLAGVRRLEGGSKKGVYRLTLDDETSVIGYVWSAAENYWPEPGRGNDGAGPFAEASGAEDFEAASTRLEALGVRVPRGYLLDRRRAACPADNALSRTSAGARWRNGCGAAGEHYRWLRPGGLDEQRLRCYRLALHLSLIAGPLRLLDGDFPDREPLLRIAEFNIGQALAFAR